MDILLNILKEKKKERKGDQVSSGRILNIGEYKRSEFLQKFDPSNWQRSYLTVLQINTIKS